LQPHIGNGAATTGSGTVTGHCIRLTAIVASVWLAAIPACAQAVGPADTTPPSIEYGQFYSAVELGAIFPDSKTFPDLIPDAAPATIVSEYNAAKTAPGFDLAAFVAQHFTGPTPPGPTVTLAKPDQHLLDYVASLWPVLVQADASVPQFSTLLPLPHPYVVPGGRFREVFTGIPTSPCSGWSRTGSTSSRWGC
jgi:neutral trehalase